MRRICLIIFLFWGVLAGSGCVMFHGAAMVKQYVTPNVVPTFFPHLALCHAMIQEGSYYGDNSFDCGDIPAYFFAFGLIPVSSLFLMSCCSLLMLVWLRFRIQHTNHFRLKK